MAELFPDKRVSYEVAFARLVSHVHLADIKLLERARTIADTTGLAPEARSIGEHINSSKKVLGKLEEEKAKVEAALATKKKPEPVKTVANKDVVDTSKAIAVANKRRDPFVNPLQVVASGPCSSPRCEWLLRVTFILRQIEMHPADQIPGGVQTLEKTLQIGLRGGEGGAEGLTDLVP